MQSVIMFLLYVTPVLVSESVGWVSFPEKVCPDRWPRTFRPEREVQGIPPPPQLPLLLFLPHAPDSSIILVHNLVAQEPRASCQDIYHECGIQEWFAKEGSLSSWGGHVGQEWKKHSHRSQET